MENLQNHNHLLTFFFIFFFLLCNLHLCVSADYSLPTQHFINCGSTDTVPVGNTNFTGDSIANSLSFTKSSTDRSNASSVSDFYQTARIFREANSSYRFEITAKGTLHFVRLHFQAFASAANNFSQAVFNVSVQGLTLLSNFTVPDGSAVVEEFMMTINSGEFILKFNPLNSSFAFVNAIEVFTLPDGFIAGEAPTVGTQGQIGNSSRIISQDQVLHTKYRVNVGGSAITPGSDSLLRNWTNDEGFLQNPEDAQSVSKNVVTYQPQMNNVTNFTAPPAVYETARHMNVSSSNVAQNYPNVTWMFNVSANARHMVRFHFCDIISDSPRTLSFNLYVLGNYTRTFQALGDIIPEDLAVPYKYDLVIESDQDAFIQFSIGIEPTSMVNESYLNGLEIMEMIGTWDSHFLTPSSKALTLPLIIGLAVGGFAVLCLLLFSGVFAYRRKKPKPSEPTIWSPLPVYALGSTQGKGSEQSISSSSVPSFNLGLIVPLGEILSATNNFNDKLMIGRGGFGNVYRGTLRSGTEVAVKRSEPGSSQGVYEFQTEILVLSKIRHKHLVSLVGYCCERSEMILVYEFMGKGTLREHLYGSNLPPLSWKQRLEICVGAARGLHYLHKGAAGGIIHRDVKSTNILLDDNFIAKVADFGLSKLGGSLDQSTVSTGFKGTFGYLDPEYLKTQQLTEKSDVYAFGVVLLEVLCARPPIDPLLPREQMNLAEWGTANIHRDSLEQIIDPRLDGNINPNSLRKFGETTLKCLQEDDEDRPHMDDVLWDLEYALQLHCGYVPKDSHDESLTNGSSMLAFSNVGLQRIPSLSMSFVDNDLSMVNGDEVTSAKSEAFSQLQSDNGR